MSNSNTVECPSCGSSWLSSEGYCPICRTHATPEALAACRHYFEKLSRLAQWRATL